MARLAREHGVDAPYNDAVAILLRAMNTGADDETEDLGLRGKIDER
ncbi:MAG: hypothetical protein HC923_02305 [Myxococcales bacterium]|nr:hypothetical protein [Myxococcales bacterium]